jgi:hypothetical protein
LTRGALPDDPQLLNTKLPCANIVADLIKGWCEDLSAIQQSFEIDREFALECPVLTSFSGWGSLGRERKLGAAFAINTSKQGNNVHIPMRPVGNEGVRDLAPNE